MKTFTSILFVLILFGIGTIIAATGNNMDKPNDFVSFIAAIITVIGLIIIAISGICAFSIYQTHKDKLREFTREE